jgi:hypothetical protein
MPLTRADYPPIVLKTDSNIGKNAATASITSVCARDKISQF